MGHYGFSVQEIKKLATRPDTKKLRSLISEGLWYSYGSYDFYYDFPKLQRIQGSFKLEAYP